MLAQFVLCFKRQVTLLTFHQVNYITIEIAEEPNTEFNIISDLLCVQSGDGSDAPLYRLLLHVLEGVSRGLQVLVGLLPEPVPVVRPVPGELQDEFHCVLCGNSIQGNTWLRDMFRGLHGHRGLRLQRPEEFLHDTTGLQTAALRH